MELPRYSLDYSFDFLLVVLHSSTEIGLLFVGLKSNVIIFLLTCSEQQERKRHFSPRVTCLIGTTCSVCMMYSLRVICSVSSLGWLHVRGVHQKDVCSGRNVATASDRVT